MVTSSANSLNPDILCIEIFVHDLIALRKNNRMEFSDVNFSLYLLCSSNQVINMVISLANSLSL